MRLLRTMIIGGVMLLPGLLLTLIIWYMAGQPMNGISMYVICNGIPLLSVSLGLVFGWQTGEEYSVKMES